MSGRSVKSFYGNKTYHRFIHVRTEQVINDNSQSADIVMIGPQAVGNEWTYKMEMKMTLACCQTMW